MFNNHCYNNTTYSGGNLVYIVIRKYVIKIITNDIRKTKAVKAVISYIAPMSYKISSRITKVVRIIASYSEFIQANATRFGTGLRQFVSYSKLMNSSTTRRGIGWRIDTAYTSSIKSFGTRVGNGLRMPLNYVKSNKSVASRVGAGLRQLSSYVKQLVNRMFLPEVTAQIWYKERKTILKVERTMSIKGNTIRLKVKFHTWDGIPADPQDVILRIYSWDKEQIGEDIIPNRIDIGVYEYDYTLPMKNDRIYCEFSGLLEGKPIVARNSIDTMWT